MERKSSLRTIAKVQLFSGIFLFLWKLLTFLIMTPSSMLVARLIAPLFMIIAGAIAFPRRKHPMKIIQNQCLFAIYQVLTTVTSLGEIGSFIGNMVIRIATRHCIYWRYEAERYEMDRYETERYGLDRYGMERYGLDRYGMDSYGLERYGLDNKQIYWWNEAEEGRCKGFFALALIILNGAAMCISISFGCVVWKLRSNHKRSVGRRRDRDGPSTPRTIVETQLLQPVTNQQPPLQPVANQQPPLQPLLQVTLIQTTEGPALLQPIQPGGMQYQSGGMQYQPTFQLIPIQNGVNMQVQHPPPSAPPSGEPPPYAEVKK